MFPPEGAATAATKISEPPNGSESAVSFLPLDAGTSLATLLQLEPPAFRTVEETFLQLEYLADYVRREDLSPLQGRSVTIEPHYVDRDFMADHSVLFASTLRPPPNYCRRIHFFAGNAATTQKELMALGPILAGKDLSPLEQYKRACDEFSSLCEALSRQTVRSSQDSRWCSGVDFGRVSVRALASARKS